MYKQINKKMASMFLCLVFVVTCLIGIRQGMAQQLLAEPQRAAELAKMSDAALLDVMLDPEADEETVQSARNKLEKRLKATSPQLANKREGIEIKLTGDLRKALKNALKFDHVKMYIALSEDDKKELVLRFLDDTDPESTACCGSNNSMRQCVQCSVEGPCAKLCVCAC